MSDNKNDKNDDNDDTIYTNIIKKIPNSLQYLFKKNNIKIQKKIIKELATFPIELDKQGWVYGFLSKNDKNIRNNFYIKIGRTDKSNPIERINEWSTWNPHIKILQATQFNRKLESLAHLFFNYVHEIRLTDKKEKEWFHFTEKINLGSYLAEMNELIEDLFCDDDKNKDDENNYESTKYNKKKEKTKQKININTATQKELEKLPGIGKAFAKNIYQHRIKQKFNDIRDIMNVKGVGVTKFNDIKNIILTE